MLLFCVACGGHLLIAYMDISVQNEITAGPGLFKAKFHYAIWSQTGPKLVADGRPAAS